VFGGNLEFFPTDQLPIEKIAKAIGVHPNTVSGRIQRMADARFFFPTVAFVDCNRLGFVGGRFFIPMPLERRPRERLQDIFRVPGLFGHYDSVQGWDFILFAETDRVLESRAKQICESLGHRAPEWETRFGADWPNPSGPAKVGPLDVRILRAFLKHPSKSAKDLVPHLGLTARTVQSRVKRMRSGGILRMYIGGDVAAERITIGYLRASLAPTPEGKVALGMLRKLTTKSFIQMIVPRKPRFMLWSASLGSLAALAEEAADIPGVLETRFRLLLGYRWNPAYPDWVCDLLERRIGPAGLSQRATAPRRPAAR
jgi:DNA-binding Lrp family transcriptional regulator